MLSLPRTYPNGSQIPTTHIGRCNSSPFGDQIQTVFPKKAIIRLSVIRLSKPSHHLPEGPVVSGAHTLIHGPPGEYDESGDLIPWNDEDWRPVEDLNRQVFCNRSINMSKIQAVGFDLDYTLAQYVCDEFEELAYRLTKGHLVNKFDYPASLSRLTLRFNFLQKGLILDKKRGNVLKIDRHQYVKQAYHGFSPLPRKERIHTYSHERRDVYDDRPDLYGMVDTLFSLAEAYLWLQLVEMKDAAEKEEGEGGGELSSSLSSFFAGKSYSQLYLDVRQAVDMCHRDGSLKKEVTKNPDKYIHRDSFLVPTIRMIRDSGKQVFLATNSLWDYCHIVMNFLVDGKVGSKERDTNWLREFDLVVVGCRKPGFFTDANHPLFLVDAETGGLQNTNSGAPTVSLDNDDNRDKDDHDNNISITTSGKNSNDNDSIDHCFDHAAQGFGDNSMDDDEEEGGGGGGDKKYSCPVLQGGSFSVIHDKLKISKGDEVLYLGDHIYGDIVKSKKAVNWRTLLVVPELEAELREMERNPYYHYDLLKMQQKRGFLEAQMSHLKSVLAMKMIAKKEEEGSEKKKRQKREEEMEALQRRLDRARYQHQELIREYHANFHSVWGQVMKTGYQDSFYASQVSDYACLYTSHVSNLLFVDPNKNYKAPIDMMPHEAAVPTSLDPELASFEEELLYGDEEEEKDEDESNVVVNP